MSGEALTTLDDHFLLGELKIIIISQVIQYMYSASVLIIFSNEISVLFLVDLIAFFELKIQISGGLLTLFLSFCV